MEKNQFTRIGTFCDKCGNVICNCNYYQEEMKNLNGFNDGLHASSGVGGKEGIFETVEKKITAKELRVGNLTHDGFVMGITPRGMLTGFGSNLIEFYKIRPVKITDEILQKFGFVKSPLREYYVHESELATVYVQLRIANIENRWTVSIGDNSAGVVLGVYDNVHQLQNLFYAITTRELSFKE